MADTIYWFCFYGEHWLVNASDKVSANNRHHPPDTLHCLFTESRPTLCDPMDCSLPGSSVHGISQARILQWVAISSARGSCQVKDQTCVPALAGGYFTAEPPGKPRSHLLATKSLPTSESSQLKTKTWWSKEKPSLLRPVCTADPWKLCI